MSNSKNTIAVVGGTNTGKTTFFAVLDRALRDKDFALTASIGGAATKRSNEFIYKLRQSIAAGYFPPQTVVGDEFGDFELTITAPDGADYCLSFIDPPGELFENRPLLKQPSEDSQSYEARQAKLASQRREFERVCERANAMMVLINIHGTSEHTLEGWRYTLENFVNRATAAEEPIRRLAIVFTKADLLTWQRRHRIRSARKWLYNHPHLADIYRDAEAVRLSDGSKPEVGFFFSSAIGWSAGTPNCRSIVIPRELSGLTAGSIVDWEDLIPDPAVIERDDCGYGAAVTGAAPPLSAIKRGGLMAGSLPAFQDPLRIVHETPSEERLQGRPIGILTLPGRRHPKSGEVRAISPWNIVEPLLWAGGYPELPDSYGR